MNFHERTNVNRVFRAMSREWGVPVWKVKQIVQESIDKSWEKAMENHESRSHWEKYFPEGKPSAEQYILLLGLAHEKGEDVPFLLED